MSNQAVNQQALAWQEADSTLQYLILCFKKNTKCLKMDEDFFSPLSLSRQQKKQHIYISSSFSFAFQELCVCRNTPGVSGTPAGQPLKLSVQCFCLFYICPQTV
ncbi:hypothetical protein DNTS_033802 [Danionella cerebrum]|uniref:Uncharacterized protein n=1 Tax=Danionella cerebrum TaxID=2873325 RepID=A0A553ML64_9TELE|nr:hypothetical protein DNTS_033802 [Danionella translucida]